MDTKSRKIAIFSLDLKIGGVQKSLLNLLKKLDKDQYQIDLFLVDREKFFDDEIPPGVEIRDLPKLPKFSKYFPFRIAKGIFGRKFNYLKSYGEYDLTIDFNGFINESALGALFVPAKKRVIWIHIDLETQAKFFFKYRVACVLQKSKYALFDQTAVVSAGLINSTAKKIGIDTSKIVAVNNIIDVAEILARKDEEIDIDIDKNKYNLVGVGRLNPQKGIGITLDLIAEINQRIGQDKIHLYWIGDGPEREKLERKIKVLNLENVSLMGAKTNPFAYMNRVNGFISNSICEGAGLNILEAKVLGMEIFIPKSLEKNTYQVSGRDNLLEDIIESATNYLENKNNVSEVGKKYDYLDEYNANILLAFDNLF